MNKKEFVLILALVFLFLISLNFVSAFIIQSATPRYFNRTINTLMNFTINNTDARNITQVTISLPQGAIFYSFNTSASNNTDATSVVFSNTSTTITWQNITGNAVIQNISQTKSFWFNISLTDAGDKTFTVISNDTGAIGNISTTTLTLNFAFSGYVKNETGGNVTNATVEIYQFVQQPNSPPTEILDSRVNSSSDGSFILASINGSGNMYKLKMYYRNATGGGNITKIGNILPPFPAMMFYPQTLPPGAVFEFMKPPALNGTTFYLQGAATLNIYANNISNYQKFGYMLTEQKTGFPIESNIMNTVANVNITVPIGRNYTIMFVRAPFGSTAFGFDPALCRGSFMNDSLCPTPPISNSTLGNLVEGQSLLVNQSLITSEYRLTGCIIAGNNNTAINITKIIPKMIPWEGFVPPIKSDRGDINLTADINYTGKGGCSYAFYNISVLGSLSGLRYLIEIYAKNASNDAGNPGTAWNLAAFQNITITNHTNYNVTLFRLVGNYQAEGDVNTSKMKINIQNSTGGAITTNMHVDVKIKNPATGTIHYIIESLSNGSFYIPILNNSNWAKVLVFANDAPPKEISLNLSVNENNITLITMSDGRGAGFKRINATGQPEMINSTLLNSTMPIQMRFLRYSDPCNIVNPPSSCEITSMSAKDFNPFKALVAGKINMEMKLTSSNVTLMFMNFDMFTAKQPPMDSVMNDNASQSSSSNQVWQFGSFAPSNTYEKVIITMPYSDNSSSSSHFNESFDYINMSIPLLYDENWNVVWNKTRGDTSANLTDDFLDYNSSSLYRNYLTSGGVSCSKTDPNLNSTPCYINTTGNAVYIEIPHFSGVGPSVSGSAVAAATTTTTPGAGGGTGAAANKTKSYSWTKITPGAATIWKLVDKDLGIKQISITVNNPAQNVQITITKYDGKPAEVTKEKSGKVYKYLKIEEKNLGKNLSKAIITIQVEKSWLTNKSLTKENISLFKFDGDWKEITTAYKEEDTTNYYYDTELTSFSYFAIAEKVEAAAVTCTPSWTCGEWSECAEGAKTRICTDSNTCGIATGKPAESETCGEEKKPILTKTTWAIIIGVVIAVIVIILIYTLYKKKR